MMETAVIRRDQEAVSEFTAEEVVAQVQKVQQIMRLVMRDGEHFGKIPGCGDKPTLLKPGAEKLSFTFRLAPRFFGEREPQDLGNGHLQYVIKCELYHIQSGAFAGSGLGSCSTMEAKYRWKSGPKTSTGRPVPKEYWEARKSDPARGLAMLGGKGFTIGKNEAGVWEIFVAGDRVENDNLPDTYNTVLKIAKKRAHIDAVLTATAASDIFTQDLEDMDAVVHAVPVQAEARSDREPPEKKAPAMPQRKSAQPPASAPALSLDGNSFPNEEVISDKQRKRFYAIWRQAGIPEDAVKAKLKEYGYEHSADISRADYNELCTWAETYGLDAGREMADYDDSNLPRSASDPESK